MAIDLKLLQQLADPAKALKDKEAGLPVPNLDSFKSKVTEHLDNQSRGLESSAMQQVTGIIGDADSLIQQHMESVSNTNNKVKGLADVGSLSRNQLTKQATSSLSPEIMLMKLKQAKEHAVATGNFIPLLAFTQPDLNLKSLTKGLVVLPDLPNLPDLNSVKDKLKSLI